MDQYQHLEKPLQKLTKSDEPLPQFAHTKTFCLISIPSIDRGAPQEEQVPLPYKVTSLALLPQLGHEA